MLVYFLNNSSDINPFIHTFISSLLNFIKTIVHLTESVREHPFYRGELRTVILIGLKALFPAPGPHAAYPHSNRYQKFIYIFSWDIDTHSEL
jgi:hypothetical protein